VSGGAIRTGGRTLAGGGRSGAPARRAWGRLAAIGAAMAVAMPVAADGSLRGVTVVGDAIPVSLTGEAGNPERGRAIVTSRQVGLCLLCHTGPFPEERFQGSLAPDLRGAGSRLSPAQLRLRLVDSSRLKPDTIMPSYYRIDHLTRVGHAWQGKPVLTAQQIEDVVAFLATLRDRTKSGGPDAH
jgi:sulfur-oxidizing protein SoxX